jgi:hypothetical protein
MIKILVCLVAQMGFDVMIVTYILDQIIRGSMVSTQ